MSRPDWMLPEISELTEFPVDRIAKQLGALCRYAGATPDHYSVARHSLLVVSLLPEDPAVRLLGLIHDAHECWTGDLLRPATKRLGPALSVYQDECDAKLWKLLGLDPHVDQLNAVAAADSQACLLEMRLLGKSINDVSHEISCDQNALWHLMFHGNSRIDAQHWREEFYKLVNSVG
jgi:hypothetical protein